MPKYLAIEWDDHQIRALVAGTSGDDATAEQAAAIDIPREGDKPSAPQEVGKTLARWMNDHGVGRLATLVAVGRASIELKRMTLPPAPNNELPQMVRFQAQREFTSLADDSPLDFLPLSENETAPRDVLAASVSADLLKQIHLVCEAAGLRAERIVLRPCATAAVVRQHLEAGQQQGARLIVDPLLDEADLSVLVDGKVSFIRTVRLPHAEGGAENRVPLLGELRRTMAAFHNQFSEQRIEAITVCGHTERHAGLRDAIEEQLKLPTNVVNPLEVVRQTSKFKKDLPDRPGHYAPLVGMVLDEAAESHAIDFLNPRRTVEEKTSRLTYVLAATAALLLVAAYAYWQYDRISVKQQELADLQSLIKAEQQTYKMHFEPQESRFEAIASWENSDVNWLDEFRRLAYALREQPLDSKDYPEEDDVVVETLVMSATQDGGQFKLDAIAKNQGVVNQIEQRVRQQGRQISVEDSQTDNSLPGYDWRFQANVIVPGASSAKRDSLDKGDESKEEDTT